MRRATSIVRKAELAGRKASDSVTLDREGRFRRRISMTSDGGTTFLLDLSETTYLAPGDNLVLENGSLICIQAAPEDLLEVRSNSKIEQLRVAWHLGNRHTPAEITPDAIFIQHDHVLAKMLEGLGASVTRVHRPFEPEGGAYGGRGALQHGHHNDGHAHGHHIHSHD